MSATNAPASNLSNLLSQRDELNKKIESIIANEKAEAIEKIKLLIKSYGISMDELGFRPQIPNSPKKIKSVARYFGPNGEQWSGRGRAPNWITALETKGHDRKEFLKRDN